MLNAAGVPVAAAVYGPSQSGKSLFLGHVLMPREPQYSPLGRDEALGEPAYYPGLSFTQDLNPQCGSMEATALVTRFTTKDRVPQDVLPPYPVMAYALTRADWLRVLGRGFQAECRWSSPNRWTPDNLEAVLIELAADSRTRGDRVDRQWRMDLSDAYDHMKRHDEQRFLSNGAEFGGLLTRYPLSETGYTEMAARLLWDGWSTLTSLFSLVLDFLNVHVRRDRAALISARAFWRTGPPYDSSSTVNGLPVTPTPTRVTSPRLTGATFSWSSATAGPCWIIFRCKAGRSISLSFRRPCLSW